VRSIRHGWEREQILNALAIGPNVPYRQDQLKGSTDIAVKTHRLPAVDILPSMGMQYLQTTTEQSAGSGNQKTFHLDLSFLFGHW
jgi:hypothetical protein